MRNMKKNVRNWLLEGIKNMDENLIYWIIFNFAKIRGFFLNMWLLKCFNRVLLTGGSALVSFSQNFAWILRTNFEVLWSLTCTWTGYFSKIVAWTWTRRETGVDRTLTPIFSRSFEIFISKWQPLPFTSWIINNGSAQSSMGPRK